MSDYVPVEIQIRGRVKRGRYRKLATATLKISSDKPVTDALREALDEAAESLSCPDE